MNVYIIRRLLMLIPTVLLVTIIIFFVVFLVPGDIVDAMRSKALDVVLDRAAIEKAFGLDAPVLTQYGRWLGVIPQVDGNFSGVFQGDFGVSWWQSVSVLELIAPRWPVTIELGIIGLIIGQLIAVPIGVYSALRQDTWGDYISRTFAIACIAVPSFWLGTMVIVFPSIWWGYMPSIMLIPFTEDPVGNLQMFIIPAIILGMSMGGMTMRMTRTMMLEVLRQDYIRTAWAKGLKERGIIMRHALKNALIPVITVIGFQVPVLIGGTVIIEQIFCLPGMGRLLMDAILGKDHPLICAVVLLYSIGLVLINLMVDLTYAYLDPRVHYK